ncbi:hypothetical protein TNCV_4844381 [Trichonephila clavipes]|uniref:Uncharacterized protein n=1 Tax=Trichonephila clavipes TaxID=2585209 RepID=A0A8X6WL67_TRICX|nr:hypothetical protein TNCV_4844381 [Trichonephila clavipes]
MPSGYPEIRLPCFSFSGNLPRCARLGLEGDIRGGSGNHRRREETRPVQTRVGENGRREKTWSEEESVLDDEFTIWLHRSISLVHNESRRRSEMKQRDKIQTAVIFLPFEHDTD